MERQRLSGVLTPGRPIWQFDIPDAVSKEEKVRPAYLIEQRVAGVSFDVTCKCHLLRLYLVQNAQFYGGAHLGYQFISGPQINADIRNRLKEPGPFSDVSLLI